MKIEELLSEDARNVIITSVPHCREWYDPPIKPDPRWPPPPAARFAFLDEKDAHAVFRRIALQAARAAFERAAKLCAQRADLYTGGRDEYSDGKFTMGCQLHDAIKLMAKELE